MVKFFKRGDLDGETFVDGLNYGLEVLMVYFMRLVMMYRGSKESS